MPSDGSVGAGEPQRRDGYGPEARPWAAAIPFVIFAGVVLFLFRSVIFGDRILLDPSPFLYDPWRYHAGAEDLNSEMHQGDNLRCYLPRTFQLWEGVRSGRLPLWNPYVFAGTPFLADPQTRVAYPVSLVLTCFHPTKAMGYDIAIHVFLAMVGMFLFIRSLRGSVTGGMVAALGYGLSSFMYTRFGHPTFVASAAWIPFFFYGFEKAQVSERKGTLLLAVFLALGFLAGFPQVSLFGVGSLAIYVVYMTIHHAACRRWHEAGRNLKVLAVSGVLALLLASVILVPFVELLRNSAGLGIEFQRMKKLFQPPPLLLLRSIVPGFFGNPVDRTDWRIVLSETQKMHVSLFQVYCGIGSLVAAISGLVFIRRAKHIGAFLVLLVLSVGVAINSQILRVAYRLAFMGYSKIDRACVVSCFALAALAGLGFSLISGEDGRKRRTQVMVALFVFAVVLAAGSVYFWSAGSSLLHKAADEFMSLPDGARLNPWDQMRSARVLEWSRDPAGSWLSFEKMQVGRMLVFSLAGLLLLSLCAWLRVGASLLRRLAQAAFLAALLVELLLIAGTYLVSQPEHSFFEPEGIKYLRNAQGEDGRWRIGCINSAEISSYPYETAVLPPNLNQISGISSLQGTYTTMPVSQAEFWKLGRNLSPGTRMGRERSGVFAGVGMPLASLMSVRHLIDGAGAQARTASPVLQAIAEAPNTGRPLRLLSLGGDTRLAFLQTVNEPASVDLDLSDVIRLDACLGFEIDRAAPGESFEASVTCVGNGRQVQCRRSFDLSADCGAWHEIRLDVSSVANGNCRLTVAVSCSGLPQGSGVTAGWSGFDLVREGCRVTGTGDGYRVDLNEASGTLSLRVTSPCRQIPLTFVSGDGRSALRWVAFPDGMPSRQVSVNLNGMTGKTVAVRSDSVFDLVEAKRVTAIADRVNYDLIYDRDMKIYENFAAVEKAVCFDKAAIPYEESGRGATLKFAAVLNLADARCGSARILRYEPERVLIEAQSERPCYLLLQDTYYPGWVAYIDGGREEICKTDLGARAVELPPGRHEVVFRFEPASFRLGLVGSSLGAVLLILYGVVGSRLGRKRLASSSHSDRRQHATL